MTRFLSHVILTPKNNKRGFKGMTKISKDKMSKAVAKSLFKNGIEFYMGFGSIKPDYDTAFECFYKANLQGVKGANFWLAKCYQFGHGTPKNYAEANKLFEEVANYQSDHRGTKDACAVAQYYISQNYRAGRGVKDANNTETNTKIANMYLAKSAKNDYPEAQYEMGARYLFGKDIKQDNEKAIRYLISAANPKNIHPDCSSLMIPGHAKAQALLGWCYKNGVGVQNIDTTKAIAYIHSASVQQNMDAKYELNENIYDAQLEKFEQYQNISISHEISKQDRRELNY